MTTAQDQQSRAEFPSGIAAASVLRAMAMNYRAGHLWDALDERACINAANEIDRLKAELQAARAMSAAEPVAWIEHDEGGVAYMPYYDAARKLPGRVKFDLFTASQVQAMGRVPPGHVAVPVDADLQARCAEILNWQKTGILPGDALRNFAAQEYQGDPHALQMAEAKTARQAYAMLAAPRPPAAQEGA